MSKTLVKPTPDCRLHSSSPQETHHQKNAFGRNNYTPDDKRRQLIQHWKQSLLRFDSERGRRPKLQRWNFHFRRSHSHTWQICTGDRDHTDNSGNYYKSRHLSDESLGEATAARGAGTNTLPPDSRKMLGEEQQARSAKHGQTMTKGSLKQIEKQQQQQQQQTHPNRWLRISCTNNWEGPRWPPPDPVRFRRASGTVLGKQTPFTAEKPPQFHHVETKQKIRSSFLFFFLWWWI